MARQPRTEAKTLATGSLAAPLHGGYAVQPGSPDGIEYFEPTLDGLGAALSRAGWLSVGGPDQTVTALRPGGRARAIWAYSHGRCTFRPACVIPAPEPAAVPS